MSELENRNAEAVKVSLEITEARIQEIENRLKTMENNVGTLGNLINVLQQNFAKAINAARGTGPTA